MKSAVKMAASSWQERHEDTWTKIQEIDFSKVKAKLIALYGDHYTPAIADTAVEKYKKWLLLQAVHGNQHLLVPTIIIDAVWHEHILRDLELYIAETTEILGVPLQHRYGLADNHLEEQRAIKGFTATQKLWEDFFGESMAAGAFSLALCDSGYCDSINRSRDQALASSRRYQELLA